MSACPWCGREVGGDYSVVGKRGRKYHPACRDAKDAGAKPPARTRKPKAHPLAKLLGGMFRPKEGK